MFFARLTELRNGGKPHPAEEPDAVAPVEEAAAEVEAPVSEVPAEEVVVEETAVVEVEEAPVEVAENAETEAVAPAEEPVAEEAPEAEAASEPDPAPEAEAPAPAPAAETAPERTARDQARLVAAIERVGGPDVIRQALQPKRDEAGKPLKWAAVCCEASQGLKPGDPSFLAWVRLAATPVREIKTKVPDDRPERGGRGGGRGTGGPRRDGGGQQGGGGFRGGPRRDDRGSREGRASREDMAMAKAYGGRVGAKIVIPGFELTDDDGPTE